MYHMKKAAKSAAKCFARKSITRQLRIFSPVNCKLTFTRLIVKQ